MDQSNSIKPDFEQFGISKNYRGDLDGVEHSGDGAGDGYEYNNEVYRPPLREVDKHCMAKCLCLPARYTIAVMICIGLMVVTGMRCNLFYAMKSLESNNMLFLMYSSFFWGYLLAQIPGGFIARYFSATKMFSLSIVSSAALNLLIPLVISQENEYVAVGVLLLQGLIEGVCLPAVYGIWRFWAPPMERSRLVTLALTGTYAGNAVGHPISKFLADGLGHNVQFYIYSVFGIIWYMFWLWLCFENPHKHPCISRSELKHIERSLGESTTQSRMARRTTAPCCKLVTSMPVYAIIVVNLCSTLTFYTINDYQSMSLIHNFDFILENREFLVSLPYLIMTLGVPFSGLLADFLRKNGIMSTTNVRKLFTCGGLIIQGLCFLCVPYVDTPIVVIFALICGTAVGSFAISNYNVNCLDIAPRYASILMGLSFFIGSLVTFIVPYTYTSLYSTTVYVIVACVRLFGGLFYAIFASGELQSWAKP